MLPAEVVMLTLDLQARGFVLTPDSEDLIVRPFSKLTAEDCRQLRRWKQHVIALLSVEVPHV